MVSEYNPVGWFEPDIVSTLERVKKGSGRGGTPRFGTPPPRGEAA
jgi:hypothetical protein